VLETNPQSVARQRHREHPRIEAEILRRQRWVAKIAAVISQPFGRR
jgi:hypothetical protein